MKKYKKSRQGPPPPYLDKIQKNNSFFSRENVPKPLSMQGCVQISNWKDQSKDLLLSMFFPNSASCT